MERILDVAQFLVDEYQRVYDEPIDTLKLQKLLYLSQRESYAVSGEFLFCESMQGWTYGPVSLDVRRHFRKGRINVRTNTPSQEAAYILRNVVLEYGQIEPWALVDLTHGEQSWKNSRKGLGPKDKGDTPRAARAMNNM